MRNIRRSTEHEVVVRMLAEKPHPKTQKSIFPTMRELLCFSACLGFHQDKRSKLSGKILEIDGRVFENSEQAVDLLYLIALATAKDANVLLPEREDEAIEIFEEYANGGFEVIRNWLAAKPGDTDGDIALFGGLATSGFLRDVDPTPKDAIGDVKF